MRPLLLVICLLLVAPAAARADGLPLGAEELPEARATQILVPGVTHTRIVRGTPDAAATWGIDAAVVAERAEADALAVRLGAAGAPVRVDAVGRGQRVRTGAFATQAEADAERARLTGLGFTGLRTVYSAEDGTPTTGPWVVNAIEAPPWRVRSALATDVVPGRELLTGLAARRAPLAAINGGYFVIGAENGTDGDLAGLSVLGGAVVSEAVDGRTSLILRRAGASVDTPSDDHHVRAGGAMRELSFNRAPGLIRGCGGTGGDAPTEAPKHDFTCTDASELIAFTPDFGAATPAGDGTEVVLSARGRVLALRPRGGPISPDGSVLAGSGDATAWLAEHAEPGQRLRLRSRVTGERGALAFRARTAVVNGGPRLLRAGRTDITAVAEGFDWPEDPGFLYRFGLRRNSRTLAGITPGGRVLLVTVEGRQPGYSAGVSFAESAAIMRALGARDAVNLDGGGSTGLTLGAELLTRPSDATGERPIGDALLIF